MLETGCSMKCSPWDSFLRKVADTIVPFRWIVLVEDQDAELSTEG
jgi:hypothetical protein